MYDYIKGTHNPIDYDKETLTILINKYGKYIDKAILNLYNDEFEFESMQSIHEISISNQKEIIYRQCLPICIIYNIYFPDKLNNLDKLIQIYCLCQTLILNNIDRHLDHKQQLDLLSDCNRTTTYVVASLLKGILISTETENSKLLLKNMLSTTMYIIQSMNDNYIQHYDENIIHNSNKYLNLYKTSKSRHLGSGFYESGIRSVFGYNNSVTPTFFDDLLPKMRILRQRIDEIADLFEDLSGGLITYPVLLLMSKTNIDSLIIDIWNYTKNTYSNKTHLKEAIKYDEKIKNFEKLIDEKMKKFDIYDILYLEALNVYNECITIIKKNINYDDVNDLIAVLNLKIAFLDRLKNNNWKEIDLSYNLLDLRRK